MKKIYDVEKVFMIYGEDEICAKCEFCSYFYESDTGYESIQCTKTQGDDCQEAIGIFMKENGEVEKMIENNNEMKKNNNEMNLTVDLNSLKESIVSSIKNELKQELKQELKNELIKKTYEEVSKPILEDIKHDVSSIVSNMLKEEIETYYTQSKIIVGGGFYEEAQEYTVKEYTQLNIKEALENGIQTSYGAKKISAKDYLLKNCITNEISSFMKKELENIQKDVNKKVQEVFETKINNMMSEVALGVLKSNATYNDITKKLLGE